MILKSMRIEKEPCKTGVVITGGDFQALAVLRTMAKRGIPVIVLDSDLCISRYSRYRKKFVRAPKLTEERKYIQFLLGLSRREKITGWVLFPNSDEAVYLLSKYRDILEDDYKVITPSWDVIQNVYVKEKTYKLAAAAGIDIPETFYPRDVKDLIQSVHRFPVVLKPSIRDNFYRHVKVKAYRVDNPKELVRRYERMISVIDPSEVLVQEFIPGGPKHLYSFCPFFKEGKVIAGIMGRRSRQHPMDFGHASTFVELVHIPELRRIAEKFLRLVNYYGIAEVEFMQDPRDRKYKLIEVNPRVWGWHSLAIAAGVDLPFLQYQDSIGERDLTTPTPQEKLKWIRLTTDFPSVCMEIIRGRMKVQDYISSIKGEKEFAVFSKKDPLPFLMELALIPYLWKKRGF
jgi:D-aspartate ligase